MKKADLQVKAAGLGVEGYEKMTVKELTDAIERAEKPVIPLNPEQKGAPQEEAPAGPPPPKPIILDLNDVNGYLNIIGIVMVDDVRAQSLSRHFMDMIQARNPHIQPKGQQPQLPPMPQQ